MSENSEIAIPPRLLDRFKFIEFKLFWELKFNRSSLITRFGISLPQATVDLKLYQEKSTNELTYNVNLKHYVPSKTFKPRFYSPCANDLLNLNALNFNGIEYLASPLPIHGLPTFHRNVNIETLRDLVISFRDKTAIQIQYQSPQSEEPTSRWITPSKMIFTLNRWHLRAYCHLRNDFRAFVLGRIIKVESSKPADPVPIDNDWETEIIVRFTPDPILSKKAANIIEQDYGMNNGVVSISIRRALLEYFLYENFLVDNKKAEPGENADLRSHNGQVSIENADEVRFALRVLRNKS